MKRIRAYLVINKSMPEESDNKIAGVFWEKRNAKNFAWQLNTESTDAKTGETFIVKKYWFAPKRSAAFLNNVLNVVN